MQVWYLGQVDPLREEMGTRSSIPDWKISWTEAPGSLQSPGLQSGTWLNTYAHTHTHTHFTIAEELSIQFSSVAQLCPTLCEPINCSIQASLSITKPLSLPKLMSIESVIQPPHPLLSAGVQLQQTRIQPKWVSSVGKEWDSLSVFLDCLFFSILRFSFII